MQADEERALANLHVIGALSHNDKLQTRDSSFAIYVPTSLRGLMRTLYGEARLQNVERIQQTVRTSMACAERLLDEARLVGHPPSSATVRVHSAAVRHVRVCEALAASCTGMHNLAQTYRDDAALMSQLNRVVNEIEDFLHVIAPHTAEMRARLDDSGRPFRPVLLQSLGPQKVNAERGGAHPGLHLVGDAERGGGCMRVPPLAQADEGGAHSSGLIHLLR
jgi:hypothetical protein